MSSMAKRNTLKAFKPRKDGRERSKGPGCRQPRGLRVHVTIYIEVLNTVFKAWIQGEVAQLKQDVFQ